MQAYLFTVLEPILTEFEETRELYAPSGPHPRRGRRLPLPRPRRRARALRRRGARALLPRRDREGDRRVGDVARRDARRRGPRRLRADRARPGRGALSRRRGAHQPAAVLGRDPHLPLPRAARAPRLGRRSRTSSRRWAPPTARGSGTSTSASTAPASSASSSTPARLDELAAELGSGRARHRRSHAGRVRLDDAHHGRRRRGTLRDRDLLERDRLGDARPRHRRARQQHARRGGPQPARLPRPRARPADDLDDGADRRAARRRARGGAGQRRLEPHPLRRPPGDPAPRRRRHARAGGGRGGARALRGRRRARRARRGRGGARAPRGARRAGHALAPAQPLLRRRPDRRARSRDGRARAAAATRAAGARSRSPRAGEYRHAAWRSTSRPRGFSTERAERPARRAASCSASSPSDGVSVDELRDAVEEDRLALLAAERVIEGDGPRYTAEEVAEEVRDRGRVPDPPAPGARASGPGPEGGASSPTPTSTPRGASTSSAPSGLPDEGLLEVARVMGMAMAQVAGATRTLTGETLMEPGLTELEISSRFEEATRRLVPMMGPLLDYTYRLHQREQIRQTVLGTRGAGDGRPARTEVTVCFADLVEFTKLGERLPMEELGRAHRAAGRAGARGRLAAGPAREADRRRRDARLDRDRPAARRGALARRGGRGGGRGLSAPARGHGARRGAAAGRRLVRAPGQRRQPDHRRGATLERALHGRGPRGGRATATAGRTRAARASRGSAAASGWRGCAAGEGVLERGRNLGGGALARAHRSVHVARPLAGGLGARPVDAAGGLAQRRADARPAARRHVRRRAAGAPALASPVELDEALGLERARARRAARSPRAPRGAAATSRAPRGAARRRRRRSRRGRPASRREGSCRRSASRARRRSAPRR